jgi:transcriptional regulator with XRE-family HTH domain
MSEFPAMLSSLMKLEDLTQAALERASGIDRTTISRFERGERTPSREQLGHLLAGISHDRARKLELLFCHLRDEADAASVAGITRAHYSLRATDDCAPEVPGTLGAELELIAAEAARHDDVRMLILDLGRMLRRAQGEVRDAGGAPGGLSSHAPLEQAQAELSRHLLHGSVATR